MEMCSTSLSLYIEQMRKTLKTRNSTLYMMLSWLLISVVGVEEEEEAGEQGWELA